MPRTVRLPRYRDVDRRDVAWWLCTQLLVTHQLPTPVQICDYFGMSRASGHRWHQYGKSKQQQFNARRGIHANDHQ